MLTSFQSVMILLQLVSLAFSRETYCPPPVKRFLRINDKVYKRMNGAVIHLNEVTGEQVARLRLRDNRYYSSPKCGVLETKNGHGFSHFGVREEYDLENFQKAEECEVYLAKTGVGRKNVKLNVMVISDVVSGLSTECQPQLSVRVTLNLKFCASEWSCEEEEDEEEDEEEFDDETEFLPGCDSEWGCEAADPVDNCPGEWGCVGGGVVNRPDREFDLNPETEFDHNPERDFDSRTAVGITPGVKTINGTQSDSDSEGEEDFLAMVYSNLMSEEMMPVTISSLIVIAVLLLLAMWCLLCRKSLRCCPCCGRSKDPDIERSISMASTATTTVDDKKETGTLPKPTYHFSRENSWRNSRNNSTRSSSSVKSSEEGDFSLWSVYPDDEKNVNNEEMLVSIGNRALYTVREEKDPTEDGLESGEWDNRSKPLQRQESRKVQGLRRNRDIPVTFYL